MQTTIGNGDLVDVGFGIVGNARRVTALGHNPDVDTGAAEDIWSGGGLYPWMASPTSLELFSENSADTAVGTGARTVLINGLDAAYNEVQIVLPLNGGTVALPTQLIRINSALIMSAGSGKINAGNILVRDSGGGTTRAIIPASYGITRQSQFTVPAGWTLQIVSILMCFNRLASGAAARSATLATFIQSNLGFYRLPLEITIGDEPPYRHDGVPGIAVAEKNDFCMRCTVVSDNNSDITAGWLGVMRKNT